MKSIVQKSLIVSLAAVLSSCAGGPGAQTGTLVGAGTGALIGGAVGRNNGNTAAGAIIGGAAGAAVGNAVGDSYDRRNYHRRYRY